MADVLKWLWIGFLAAGIIVGALATVGDWHSAKAILEALVPMFAGLAGLCAHPPWAAPAAPQQPQQGVGP